MYYSLMVCLLVFCLVYHFFCRLICHPAQLQSVQIRNWTPSDLFILGSDSETFFRIFNSIQNLIGLNSQLKIKSSTSETSGGWAPQKWMPTSFLFATFFCRGWRHHSRTSSVTWVMSSKSILTTETIWNTRWYWDKEKISKVVHDKTVCKILHCF